MSRRKIRKSQWDPYEHGISYSALSKFINDRERFRIRAVEGLSPGGFSDSLAFGNLFHYLLEWHASGIRTAAGLQRKLNQHLNSNNADEHSRKLAETARRIMLLYVDYWDDSNKHYVEQENEFHCPVRLSNGKSIPIVGKRDALFRSIDDNSLYLQENKTKSEIDHVWLESALPHNLQTMMYCYSISRDYKEAPKGFLYNIIRKPGLRQKVKERDSDFFKRIEKDIHSRPEHYFVRYTVELGPNDIENFTNRVLLPVLEQLCIWWESIKHDPFDPWTLPDGSMNPHHFIRPFGVYDSLARGKGEYFDYVTRGSTVGLVQCETLFPELENANVNKQI